MCIFVCVYIHIYAHTRYVYMCVYVHMYTYIYICTCTLPTHIHTRINPGTSISVLYLSTCMFKKQLSSYCYLSSSASSQSSIRSALSVIVTVF